MVIALNAKNKMKIVNGDLVKPNITSPIRALWERNNDMIISWILHTVVDQIGRKMKKETKGRVVNAYNMVRHEEKQREGLLPKPAISTTFSMYSNSQRLNNNYQRNFNRPNYSQGESSTQGERRGSFRKGIIYGNCNKKGYSREQCYKLVGYPVGHPLHGKFPSKPYKSQSQEYKPNRTINMVTNQDEGATVQGVQANSSQTVQPNFPSETHMTTRIDQLQNQLNQVLLNMQNNNHKNPLHGIFSSLSLGIPKTTYLFGILEWDTHLFPF
nr:reverse transcriptase, RNA-dependent DNA polymerase [Tanacetum cinerariifolium]